MIESWRWFGPLDPVRLDEIRQTGATGIVTALHEIPYGEVWEVEEIRKRREVIQRDSGGALSWNVVESLPVAGEIQRGEGDLRRRFANYRQSLGNLAAQGVTTVCYNFMPLIDWTRTDLDVRLPGGGRALRFDAVRMAAFELFLLGREAAQEDYPTAVCEQGKLWYESSGEGDRQRLLASIMAGLPGAFRRYDIASLREALEGWRGVTADDLRASHRRFLQEVVPTCEELGIRLAVHPDDPPRGLLGLPRVVSDGEDLAAVLAAVESPANGWTLCTGSLGAHPSNDVPALAERFADRIHFVHLRNVTKEPDGSFQESAHLDGDVDIPAVGRVLLAEEARRETAGDPAPIPFRPDHGHELLADRGRGTHPGYPLVGRLKGLAEIRGVLRALQWTARVAVSVVAMVALVACGGSKEPGSSTEIADVAGEVSEESPSSARPSGTLVLNLPVSVEEAYAAIPHRQTRFDPTASGIPAVELEYVGEVFRLLDQGTRARVTAYRELYHHGVSRSGAVGELDRLRRHFQRLEPPSALEAYHGSIQAALDSQVRFLESWRLAGEGYEYRGRVGGHPEVRQASSELKRAYGILMKRYAGGESSANRDAFFDVHCALDFL